MDILGLDNVKQGVWERVTLEEFIDETEAGQFRVVVDVNRLRDMPEIIKIVIKTAHIKQEYLETDGVVLLHYPTLTVITSFSYYGLDGKFIMKRFVRPVWDRIVGRLG
jgi:hypothetical protein